MTKPDYHKEQATSDNWTFDRRTPKRYRYKGKARHKDKKVVECQVAELNQQASLDFQDMQNGEIDEAIYCHKYGPCARCRCLDQELASDEE